MIEIEPLGPIEESTIATFERELGLALPQEYRNWLLAVGGGETAQNHLVKNGVCATEGSGRPRPTSSALHRKTLRHRIGTSMRVMDTDLDDPDVASTLWLTLRARGLA